MKADRCHGDTTEYSRVSIFVNLDVQDSTYRDNPF